MNKRIKQSKLKNMSVSLTFTCLGNGQELTAPQMHVGLLLRLSCAETSPVSIFVRVVQVVCRGVLILIFKNACVIITRAIAIFNLVQFFDFLNQVILKLDLSICNGFGYSEVFSGVDIFQSIIVSVRLLFVS